MLIFLLGCLAGGFIGIIIMSVLAVSKSEDHMFPLEGTVHVSAAAHNNHPNAH